MKKSFLLIVTILFLFSNSLISSEKNCSQFNKVTNWKGWKKCVKGTIQTKEIKKTKKIDSKNIISNSKDAFSNINEKYKKLREKAPKTGIEMFKKLPK